MSEVCAAMGLTNLDSLEEIIARNRANHQAYQRRLASIPGLKLLQYDGTERCNYQYVVVEVGDDATLSRDELLQVLHAENVIARRYFYPGVHRMEPYRSYFPHAHLRLPATERVCRQVLLLPTGTAVSEADIARIGDIIEMAVAYAPAVRRRIHQLNGKF
jgi:dTDP-4-amino-4,6-dideoxygalactose transaminase